MAVEGAQQIGKFRACVSLLSADDDPSAPYDAEMGLRGVLAGPNPIVAPGTSLLRVEPASLLLSACKPAEQGGGFIIRILNPTDTAQTAVLQPGFPVASASAVRLDETPADHPVSFAAGHITLDVPPHALRSIRCS
jgi:hypothetical protein